MLVYELGLRWLDEVVYLHSFLTLPSSFCSTMESPIVKLPKPVKDLASFILGSPYCYEEIVENLNFSNVPCLKLGLSKGIGMGIVFGGCIVKVPQVQKIISAKSALGVSFLSYFLETLSYIVTISYNLRSNNPFSTWGETLAITLQNMVILMLLPFYAGKPSRAILSILSLAGLYYVLSRQDIVPSELLGTLYTSTIPIVLISRVPQIYSNFSNGHTGQLSAFTVFNYFLGAVARIFHHPPGSKG
ncbi:hypothetical protein DSO57_1028022 [Entomophthora muscae]|uniref:Uncharacterized protein n=1 Tax=Entomophthora muscae TaxID=34485 RepID=A0ACC2U058_9FUNG|nr:hypothetical protein DSO57_1028022 [Entomophthora muscae]